MKVSLLVSDASTNCVGRGYILSQALRRNFEVELVGPTFGPGIWPPLEGVAMHGVDCKFIPSKGYPSFIKSLLEITRNTTGDVIYALKPLAPSYGIALLLKLAKRRPLILDIDDWELGFGRWRLAHSRLGLVKIQDPNWIGWTFLLDKLVAKADQITVSSEFLARRYGGSMVPHGQDVQFLNPAGYNAAVLRSALDLSDKKVVLFLGTPKAYKGIEDLIAAVHLLKDRSIRVLLVGADEHDPLIDQLVEQEEGVLQVMGMQPLTERPKWLAVADAVVLPQRLSPATEGQVPAKLFDAMAMAKPIVATAVSDIPSILEGCGWVVPPGDLPALAGAIAQILEHPQDAADLGERARQRCVERYSWDSMEPVLNSVVLRAIEAGGRNREWTRSRQPED